MPQTSKVSKNNTKIIKDGQDVVIKLYSTEVVRFNQDRIILRSGGYQTFTTKLRMNQASSQYGIGFYVFQEKGAWFVKTPKGDIVPFVDGMEIKQVKDNA